MGDPMVDPMFKQIFGWVELRSMVFSTIQIDTRSTVDTCLSNLFADKGMLCRDAC